MLTSADIKSTRAALGETQAAFARRFGVDQTTIHRWEKRGPPKWQPVQSTIEGLLTEARKVADDRQTEAAQ